MTKNKIEVQQKLYRIGTGQVNNEYHLWAENGIYLGGLLFPPNGQYLFDDKALEIITKALAARWGLIHLKKQCDKDKSGVLLDLFFMLVLMCVK